MTVEKSFLSDDITIRYSDTGAGTPIVLIHGFSATHEMWSVFPDLEGFRLIKIDCRGHGASDKPTNASDYGMKMVEDVRCLFDELEISQAHLVGYSMGAEISIQFTTLYPGLVLSLTAGGSGRSQNIDAGNYNMLSRSLIETGSFESVMRGMSPDMSDEAIALANSLIGGQDPVVLAAVAGAMHQIICLPHDAFSNCHFPVLGISGELDPERGNVERLAEVFPDFTLRIIGESDHMSALSDPLFYESVKKFLTGSE